MNTSLPYRKIIVAIVCWLYIFLFIYAAVNKLLDFETFRIQLGKSPVLGQSGHLLALVVPLTEIIIAALLLFRRFQFTGLLLSYALMVMFTAYIIIILNWSSFVPCSCGGILEKMGWAEHLAFNLFFTALAVMALFLKRSFSLSDKTSKTRQLPEFLLNRFRFRLLIIATFFLSTIAVVVLYLAADKGLHRNNAIERRLVQNPAILLNAMELKYNSYYIAGITGGRIYLGNTTAPLHALALDTLLQNAASLTFSLEERTKKNYTSLQFRVTDSAYFLTDRSIPAVFRGTLGRWSAVEAEGALLPFSAIEPMSANALALKFNDRGSREDELAVLRLNTAPRFLINPDLLVRQVDGIFDTDGILLYNRELKKIIYAYYYRNQYIVADDAAKHIATNRTIDTVTTAMVRIADNKSKNEMTMGNIPLVVNSAAATAGNFLYIKSNRVGSSEPDAVLKEASIIDTIVINNRNG